MPRRKDPPKLFKYGNRANWYIRDGRQAISTSTAHKEQAEWFLAQYMAEKAKPIKPTFAELLDFRAEDLKARQTSRGRCPEAFHQNLRKFFGPLKMEQISLPLINQFKETRQHVQGMLREELIEFNATMKLAEDSQLIIRGPRVKLPKKAPPRQVFLTREEANQLLEAATSFHTQLFILIAMKTGHRKGAILKLTWDRVDFLHRRLNFMDPDKIVTNKKRTIVPVESTIWDWLTIAKKMAETSYVLEYNGNQIKDIKKSFSLAVQKSGIQKKVTPHVIKHSVISWLAQDGLSIEVIADLTATNAKTVRGIYMHFSPEYLEDAAKLLSRLDDTASKLVKQHQQALNT